MPDLDFNFDDTDDLNPEIVTRIYLYGSPTGTEKRTPEQYEQLQEIDPGRKGVNVGVDTVSYMSTGPGRYGTPDRAAALEKFFNSSTTLSAGTYSKSDMIANHGFTDEDFKFVVSHAETDTSNPDYAQRTYVWGQSGFVLSEQIEFVVDSSGTRWINYLQVRPYNDNFDFESDSLKTWLGNQFYLKPQIDPNDIGRTVQFDFQPTLNDSPVTMGYGNLNYTNDYNFTVSVHDPDGWDKAEELVPGIADQLHQDGVLRSSEIEGRKDISVDMENNEIGMAIGKSLASPLVLDLGASGSVELLSVEDSNSFFDVDQDGFEEHIGWVDGAFGDGFLVYDADEDGRINDISELFGSLEAEGFSELAAWDSNSDGKISSADADWADLQLWVDANSNGFTDPEELHTLASYNIASINLANTRKDEEVEGTLITNEGAFTYTDNSTGKIVDAWFTYDNVATIHSDYVQLYSNIDGLPTLRGYGVVADLHIAMSLDNGSGGLLEMVEDVAVLDIDDLLGSATLEADFRDILFTWAGVDAVGAASRGPNVNGQELAFLEKLLDDEFKQGALRSPNPYVQAGELLSDTFDNAYNALFARFLIQTEAGSLFNGTPSYDLASDAIIDAGTINTSVLDALETQATGLANTAAREVFWEDVVRYALGVRGGEAELTSNDLSVLGAAITGSDVSLTLSEIIDIIYDQGLGFTTIDGTNSAETLNGTSGHNDIDAKYGDDTLDGGAGDDILRGGPGIDNFIYELGDGNDLIVETSTDANFVTFGSGITTSDIVLSRIDRDDLLIHIDVSGNEGTIVVQDQFKYGGSPNPGGISKLVFASLAEINLSSINFTLEGTTAGETLHGVSEFGGFEDTIYGHGGNDIIHGLAGNDLIYGGSGDDTIYGNHINSSSTTDSNTLYGEGGNDYLEGTNGADHLFGGTGNDTLEGGSGADTYYYDYADGHDVIDEVSANDIDILKLGSSLDREDISFERVSGSGGSYDLKIRITPGVGGSIILADQLSLSTNGWISFVEFSDTTQIDMTDMDDVGEILLSGTTGADGLYGSGGQNGEYHDLIYGYEGNDTIDGYDGDDRLFGGDGDDTITGDYNDYGVDELTGGLGNDTLYGKRGSDTYFFDYGDGNDSINEEYDADIDYLKLGAGIVAGDLTFERVMSGTDNVKLLIDGGLGGSILLIDHLDSGDGKVDYIELADTTVIDLTNLLNLVLTGTSANETLYGVGGSSGSYIDRMYGLGGDDGLYGYGGADILYGGDGTDTVNGGDGNDTLYGEAGTDSLSGGNGNDRLIGGDGNDTIAGGSNTDTAVYEGLYEHYSITGTTTKTVTDNESTDGVDTVTTVETFEFYDGTWNGTTFTAFASNITGTTSANTINGTSAGEYISALGGADTVNGGDGNDILRGGAGNDILKGQDGADILYGGDNTDTFSFQGESVFTGMDVIRDFSGFGFEADKIDLSDVLSDLGYSSGTDTLSDWISVTNEGADSYINIDRDGDGSTYGSFEKMIRLKDVALGTNVATLVTNGDLVV